MNPVAENLAESVAENDVNDSVVVEALTETTETTEALEEGELADVGSAASGVACHVDPGHSGEGSSVDAQFPEPVPLPVDYAQLHAVACRVSSEAALKSKASEEAEAARVATIMREESKRLLGVIVEGLPGAVMEAAQQGQREAAVAQFDGCEKFGTLCYLYLIKGPHNDLAAWQEMKRAGCVPLLTQLRDLLQPAGFRVWHSWDRATNDNTLRVAW